MNNAIIGLGSNINPARNIEKALNTLSETFQKVALSEFVETEPFGFKEQNNFINGCIQIKTELELTQFQRTLKTMEKQLGRTPSKIKFGPKIIDLDVVVWNFEIIDQDFFKRDYLKNSILELIPNLTYSYP
ncbi:hypothetical protein MNBD_BACTEROID05-42 [hydrothermal vent metagenome]|uniref:2-amino-4-hydroxy-6-hydroxymethyldihydropteridine diphosphokinase n=1 Tax=hydrothermal vent metagenome TaxID=652676 RepID=A0A3B0T6J6_9ZZZZ